jgi:biopolymer transport protein ExbB
MGAIIQEIIDYFRVGGFVMPPLFLATFVMWYAIGIRWAELRRGSKHSVRELIRRYQRPKGRHAPGGLIDGAIVESLDVVESQPPNLRLWLDDRLAIFERRTKTHRALIMSIVATAPILGLLGTVSGMIETFDALGDMTLFSQSGGIAGGISQALFTTQMGLGVAIPGLIISRLLDRKALRLRQELGQVKDILCAEYRTSKTLVTFP